jgi:hypothetical protein
MDDNDNNENNKGVKGAVDLEIKKDIDPEMIRDIFAEALKDNKVEGKLTGMMLEMLDAAMNSSKKQEAAKDGNVIKLQPKQVKQVKPPEPTTPREPSPFEQQVQANIRSAVADYISDSLEDEKVKESKELNIDTAFLKEHGASLAGSVLGAFAKSIIPEEFKLDVTPKGGEGTEEGESDQVAVKLDIGGMLQTLFDSTQKGDQKPSVDDE